MPVLFILAVLWAVVLVPPLLRSRSQHSADSIVDFNYKLDVLGRTNGNLDDSGVDPGVPSADPGILGARIVDPLSVPTGDRAFILFGLGSRCTMIGKSLADAPVLSPDNDAENPAKVYERFGLVFRVKDAAMLDQVKEGEE